MTMHVRDLQQGDDFYLLRTMERFTYVGYRTTTYGRRHVVIRNSDSKTTTLHHSCHVKKIVRAA